MKERVEKFFLSNKYSKLIIDTPLKIKLPVMIVVLAVFMFCFYLMLVNPVLLEEQRAQSQIKSMQARIPSLIKKQKDLVSLKNEIKILEHHNAEERYSIPEKHSVPIFLSTLNEAISGSGMTVIDLSPAGVEKNKYLDLYALNFKAKLSGSFPQMIKLFVALIDMKDIAVITNINIKKESDTKLLVELNLQTYSRQGVGA
ncbi:type 4a pilus biogenesis protein PilO [Francisella sp. LA112445]|jgi:type IV pilus assembly protein PilO|uniref:type 4a pilus biogenesis protein PilO n=1 Tax=Francisella sp. LA112445 TaxID=1395624 RepID=UPI001788B689|nr:type 4a pilus biogenesis protein PilO [Francisella sp. LA112445]QIW10054.1 type IV pili glycosylation protein [Francisella sp. LA112445]